MRELKREDTAGKMTIHAGRKGKGRGRYKSLVRAQEEKFWGGDLAGLDTRGVYVFWTLSMWKKIYNFGSHWKILTVPAKKL